MLALFAALLLTAGSPDAGPSPATLKDVTFYDVRIEQVKDVDLPRAIPRFVHFLKPGALSSGEEMEFDLCSFTAAPAKDGFELELKCRDSRQPRKASWRWLGPNRAVTTLLEEAPTEVAVLTPSPPQRLDALGERLAARVLPKGKYVAADGGLVFGLEADGGVAWGKGRGAFFACLADCADGAVEQVCLRMKDFGATAVFVTGADGGVVGFAAEAPGLCQAGVVLQAQRSRPALLRRR